LRLEEVALRPGSGLVGKALRDSGIRQHTGAIIFGIHDQTGQSRIDRASDTQISDVVIEEGDILIALGNEDQLNTLRDYVEGV